MAFDIVCKDRAEAEAVRDALLAKIGQSRFRLGRPNTGRRHHGNVEIKVTKRRAVLSLRAVRLREKKPYCGNHAGPCRNTFGGRKHPKFDYLEGQDWVSWNDMVNDVLDELGHSGNAGSSVCNIRKDGLRRVRYESGDGGHGDWDKAGHENHYEDNRNCTNVMQSSYPDGTPGVYGWKA